MATGEYYSVPEINPSSFVPNSQIAPCIFARRATEKAAWAGEQLADLAETRPEELLPQLFLAVQVNSLSPRTGWTTEHGRWEPKESFADILTRLARTKLVFHPKDGGKSDLFMHMYNTISRGPGMFLEEDMAICSIFTTKGKGPAHFEHPFVYSADPATNSYSWNPDPFAYAADPVTNSYSWNSDAPVTGSDDCYEWLEYVDWEAIGKSLGGSDHQPFMDPLAGPKKRPRSKPNGPSDAWDSFNKIYTKDPKLTYAACHHCGRMMKLKGGADSGTSSLLRHKKTCPCKPGSSLDVP